MNLQLQTTSSTLSKSNQFAAPVLLRKLLDIEAGDKILWSINPVNKTAQVKAIPRDWGEYLSGLGKHLWENVDVDRYIAEGRQGREIT